MSRTRQNPRTGSHPDLFFQGRRYDQGSKEGETPVFVPLSELTVEQILKLKRAAFTNAEWDELDEDVQEHIYDNDSDSAFRIHTFAAPFIKDYEWQQDPNERQYSDLEDGFEGWLRDNSHLWETMKRKKRDLYYQIVALGEEAGHTEREVNTAINEVMVDSNNYTVESGDGDEIYREEMRGHFWMDGDHIITLLEKAWQWPQGQGHFWSSQTVAAENLVPFPDELERALEKIKKDTSHTFEWDIYDIAKAVNRTGRGNQPPPGLELDWDTGEYMAMYIMWGQVEDVLREQFVVEVDEELPDDADAPGSAAPAERVLFRWKDGFYVQDLLPSELAAEGRAMGMCVGRPDMGYGKAVRNGECKILSLRRPSGKPLFTIEAILTQRKRYDEPAQISYIEQVKGKANRLPGFDLGKTDQPIKRDEVQRVYEFIESEDFQKMIAGSGGLAVDDITDMKPAARQVNEFFRAGDKWAVALMTKLGIEPEPVSAPAPRAVENPGGKSCGLHDSQCIGFCRPFQSRQRRR